MNIHPIRRLMRLVFWPLSRPLAAGLIWSHRHTISLWARSLKTEVDGQIDTSFSLSRLRLLTNALWRVSSDPRFRNDPTVRRLTIDSELTEVDRGQHAASLEETLADLPGVVAVEIDGAPDALAGAVVPGTVTPGSVPPDSVAKGSTKVAGAFNG